MYTNTHEQLAKLESSLCDCNKLSSNRRDIKRSTGKGLTWLVWIVLPSLNRYCVGMIFEMNIKSTGELR